MPKSSPTIHNDTDYAVAPMPDKVHFPSPSATLVVKATFRLVHDGVAEPMPGKSHFRGDEYLDDDIYSALLYPADLAPFKPRTDVIVLGTYHAPGGQPVTADTVTVFVGDFAKRIAVLGARTVEKGLFGSKLGPPEPFKELELGWHESYGGPGLADNPAGKGHGNAAAPRIELSHRLLRRLGERLAPACLGPVNRLWPLRKKKMGTTNKAWREERAPYPPADFDWSYHNAAPADQQLEEPLQGDERVECVNLHPEHATYTSRLPGKRVRAFVHHGAEQSSKEEVELKLDTCVLDMNAETVSLVWRGVVDVEEDALQSVHEVLVVEEEMSEEPEPAATYLARFKDDSEQQPHEGEAAEEEDASSRGPDGAAVAGAIGAQAAGVAGAVAQTDLAGEHAGEVEAAAGALGALASGASIASVLGSLGSAVDLPAELTADSPDLAETMQEAKEALEAAQQDLDTASSALDNATAGDFELPSFDVPEAPEDIFAEFEEIIAKAEELAANNEMEVPPEAAAALSELKEDMDLALAAGVVGVSGAKLGVPSMDIDDVVPTDEAAAAESEPPPPPPTEEEVRAMMKAPAVPQADGRKAAGGLVGVSLAGAILVAAKFPKGRFGGAKLGGALFTEAQLAGADFRGADLSHADFTEADLTGADFTGAKIDFAQFFEAKLDGAIFDECHGSRPVFTKAVAAAQPPSFKKAALPEAEFHEAKLAGASFAGSHLFEASFTGSELTGANFEGADVSSVRAAEAQLKGASFVGAKANGAVLVGAMLDEADFEDAELERASCNEASLVKARLFGTKAYGATLTEANLQHANAMNANLMHAALNKADLRYTSFAGSNCYGADFNDALIAETDFRDTNLKKTVIAERAHIL